MSQVLLYGPSGLPLVPQDAAIVDPTFSAVRTTSWPIGPKYDGKVLGQYVLGVNVAASGTRAVAVDCRWTSSSAVMILLRVTVGTITGTAAAAAAFNESNLFHARGWSSAPTGAVSTPVGIKVRNNMADSQAAFFVNPTADGTLVQDGVAFAYRDDLCATNVAGSASGTPAGGLAFLYRCDIAAGEQPEVFYQNEGFILNAGSVFVAGGAQQLRLTFAWAEVLAPTIREN